MLVEPFLIFGAREFQLPDARSTQRLKDLDSATIEWQTAASDSFAVGGDSPSHASMTIVGVETTEELPGECYLHRLELKGDLGGQGQKQIKGLVTRETIEGFDSAEDEWLTRLPGSFVTGASPAGYATLYAVEVEKEPHPEVPGWYYVSRRFTGLIGTKTYKRRISVNENIVSPSAPFINGLPGGWGSAAKGNLSLPRVVVTDSYVSTTAPPTADLPGASTPPDAPAINSSIAFPGLEVTLNWPHGWKLASISSEQIPGKSLWLIELSREYVWPEQPA